MRWAVLACLGTLACDAALEQEGASAQPPPVRAISLEPGVEPPIRQEPSTLAGGGVELNTNILRGTVRYTNQNPELLTLLAEDPWREGEVEVQSTQPTGYGARSGGVTFTSPAEYTFELLVEAGAGGDDGVTYDVIAWRRSGFFPVYHHARVKRRDLQPSPTEVTVEQCLGAVRFMAGTDATCATPATLNSVYTRFDTYPKQGQAIGYVPGGYNRTLDITYSVTTASGTTTGTLDVPVNVACDQIVSVCLPPPPPPPPPAPIVSGDLTGPWVLMGEPVVLSPGVDVWGGPQNAYRRTPVRAPSAPVEDPSTWWTAAQLPEGSGYHVTTFAYVRSGRDSMYVATSPLYNSATVIGNQRTPFSRVVNGETQYPFVMQPSYFYGSVRLVDPYVAQNPGASSALQSLLFADTDANGDGIPDPWFGYTSYLRGASGDGFSLGAFRDRFNSALGELSSSYELALVSPYNVPQTWTQERLRLVFQTGGSDPATYLDGDLLFRQAERSARLEPGQRYRVDHEYCFNEVRIDYWTTLGRFFAPQAAVSGGLTGRDWRDQQVSYSVEGTARGTPLARATAQQQGTIRLALPQGTFTLNPSAYMVNASGQVNQANFAPLSLELGCGQRLNVVPPLTVSISPMTVCAQAASVPVSGVVSSAPAEVDRIWYRVNDGPEVTLCTHCGINPTFSFNAELQTCGNEVEVFAFTDGMQAPAIGYQQVTWDDPSDGPSCASSCVNRPPVARCRSVTVPADSACGGQSASVNDGSYDPDAGDRFTCTQTPEGPYSAGTRRVTLTCTDDAGLSSSCEATVAVVDTTPPVLTCPASTGLECGGTGDPSAGVSAMDTCGGVPAVTCTAGTSGPSGTPVVCTATDAAGNHATCQFTMAAVDTQAPVLTCPSAVSAECTGEGAAMVTLPAATATDNCGERPAVTGGGTASYPVGTSSETYTATDPAGNSATCSTPVTVVDTQPPTLELAGPEELVVRCDASVTQGVVATDVCSGDLSHRVQPLGFTRLPGTYYIQYRVTDLAGNAAQGLQRKVTVLPSDAIRLTLLGDSFMRLECGVDTWTDPGAIATDSCGNPLEIHKYNSGDDDGDGVPGHQDPDDYGPGPNTSVEGTYSVQYIAWDARGSTQSALRTVQVDDTHAPTLRLEGSAWMTHACGSPWVDPGVVATDACYGDVSRAVVRMGYVNGWVPGLYTVRYELTDSGGNTAQPVMRTVQVTGCPW